MPFPLAHPAAVLPLRRFCPEWLSLPALVIGSLAPDAGYLFGKHRLDGFSHSLAGLLAFSLPLGLLILLALRTARSPLLRMAPAGLKPLVAPASPLTPRSVVAVALSILIGAGTHLAWDSFTHTNGWLVQRAAFLREPMFALGRHQVRVCHGLWYLSTFVGIACLMVVVWGRLQPAQAAAAPSRSKGRLVRALLFAMLMLPVASLHQGMGSLTGNLLVLLLAGLLCLAFAWCLGELRNSTTGRPPPGGGAAPPAPPGTT